MTKQDAYRIVLNDILNSDIHLFEGIYDAKNGNEKYMYGINSVMEFIAYNVSDAEGNAFSEMFNKNLIESQEKADEYQEPDNIDDDCGFDAYMGCYTDEC